MKLVAEFFAFMIERESIRQRRISGLPRAAWTDDKIFQEFSFTNVKREHDRTTQALKKIYENHADAFDEVKLLNCAIYRMFGTVESADMMGWSDDLDQALSRIDLIGHALKFTSAYIVTSAGRSEPKFLIIKDFLRSLYEHSKEIVAQGTWESAVAVMTRCYGIGSFMAKEIYLDFILASGILPEDWKTWTPVGPGGRRGAARVRYGYLTRISESEALLIIRSLYEIHDQFWPSEMEFPDLVITDIQFQLCEFDKYSRVAEGRRPKRRFFPRGQS